jgi:hypothetical protein
VGAPASPWETGTARSVAQAAAARPPQGSVTAPRALLLWLPRAEGSRYDRWQKSVEMSEKEKRLVSTARAVESAQRPLGWIAPRRSPVRVRLAPFSELSEVV